MNDIKIIEVYETTKYSDVNDYINKFHWVLLQTGTKYNEETKALTIYYSIGRPEGTSDERW